MRGSTAREVPTAAQLQADQCPRAGSDLVTDALTGRGSLAESQLMIPEKVLALTETLVVIANGGNAGTVVQAIATRCGQTQDVSRESGYHALDAHRT
jgi:hypothetical protein